MASAVSIHSVTPSLDGLVVTVVTENGFSLFHSQTFELMYDVHFENVQYAELVGGSSLMVLMQGQRLVLFSLSEKREVACLSFESVPQCVRCNQRRILVALPDKVVVFDLPSLSLLDEICTGLSPVTFISCAPNGVVALGHVDGQVSVFNSFTLERASAKLKAHSHPVSCLVFSSCSRLLATASTKGTVVKTFLLDVDTLAAASLSVFRRGTQAASIRHMSFGISSSSSDSFLLACAGDSETIHIFQGAKIAASATGVVGAVAALMPQVAKNFLDAQRAFSVVRLRCVGFENAVILSVDEESSSPALTVVSSIGFAFLYDVRPHECKLRREFSLRLTA